MTPYDYYHLAQFRVQEILAQLGIAEEVEIEDTDLLAIGAVIAAARWVCDPVSDALWRATSFWERAKEACDERGAFSVTRSDAEALEALRALVDAVRPIAASLAALCAEGAQWVLINPAHPAGTTVLTNNDRGVYDDPWDALADLAEVQRENPYIYLALVTAEPRQSLFERSEQ